MNEDLITEKMLCEISKASNIEIHFSMWDSFEHKNANMFFFSLEIEDVCLISNIANKVKNNNKRIFKSLMTWLDVS